MLQLDRSAPFAHMFGEAGVTYMQNGNFFDEHGVFIRRLVTPVAGESAVRGNWREQQELERLVIAAREIETTKELESNTKSWVDKLLFWRKS